VSSVPFGPRGTKNLVFFDDDLSVTPEELEADGPLVAEEAPATAPLLKADPKPLESWFAPPEQVDERAIGLAKGILDKHAARFVKPDGIWVFGIDERGEVTGFRHVPTREPSFGAVVVQMNDLDAKSAVIVQKSALPAPRINPVKAVEVALMLEFSGVPLVDYVYIDVAGAPMSLRERGFFADIAVKVKELHARIEAAVHNRWVQA